jgi:hypothetical protein
MKFIWIFCNESISPEVMELLERLDVEGYTVWKHVLGSHRGCRTHWGDEVWPGTNWAILVVEEVEGRAWHLLEEIRKMKQRPEIKHAGMRAFVQNAEERV